MSTHDTFLWRTDEKCPLIIIKYPPYLFYLQEIRPDMTEKLLTGTLSLNTTNQLTGKFTNNEVRNG